MNLEERKLIRAIYAVMPDSQKDIDMATVMNHVREMIKVKANREKRHKDYETYAKEGRENLRLKLKELEAEMNKQRDEVLEIYSTYGVYEDLPDALSKYNAAICEVQELVGTALKGELYAL